MRSDWRTLVSGRPDQRPEVMGSKVYLNINGEERAFVSTNRTDEVYWVRDFAGVKHLNEHEPRKENQICILKLRTMT